MTEWNDNSLCCCEYYNIEEERSHILGCCCNCQALDDAFDNLITGQRIPQHQKSTIMATIKDRIRIPWRGGAKQIFPDSLIAIILVPIAILLAAFDLILTILIFIVLIIFINNCFIWFRTNHPKTKFFVVWALMSFVVIALIFEVKVISLLEILPEENFALGVLTSLFAFFAYRVKKTANKWQNDSYAQLPNEENSLENPTNDFCTVCKKRMEERMFHCVICQCCMPERDFHFVWFNCCVGYNNNGMFLLSLIWGIAALLYSSNLTLTTVCRPFTIFDTTIMLPDDCSEVYEQYDLALCFTSAVYSILIALYLLGILLRQIIMISIGISGQEWRQLPLSTKLCCGLRSIRPYNQGFIKNWLRIFCLKEKSKSNTILDT